MRNVFLIDDDPTFANLVRLRLERDGHTVEHNPGAFGVLVAARRKPYDLILLDVQMPYINGVKLLELLRSRGRSQARIILVSVIQEEVLQHTARLHGADGYFHKGWGLERLAQLVAEA